MYKRQGHIVKHNNICSRIHSFFYHLQRFYFHFNHRYNLSDGVLLKDNHIGAAGSVANAVRMAKEYAPFVRKIEVEVETLEMVKEAVDALSLIHI